MTQRYGLSQLEALSLPGTWWELPLVPGDDAWATDLAAAMHDEESTHGGLERDLRRIRADLATEPHAHLAIGVWQPDAAAGSVAGFVTVDWLVPDPEHPVDPRTYRELAAPPSGDPERLDRAVDDVDLPAGTAVRVREVVAVRTSRLSWRRRLRRVVTYAVFPASCTDGVELRFVAFDLALADELEADAAASAAGLRVRLDA